MNFSILFFVLLISTLSILIITQLAADRLYRYHYAQKKDFFHCTGIKAGDIVFLGDSITDGACWDELFPTLPVKNRGINADTTVGVLNRLDDILTGSPAAIFLLIGTNDLPFYAYRSDRGILSTYHKILTCCKTTSPETRVYVQSIFPRSKAYKRRIQKINRELQALARQFDYPYIDVYSALVRPDGQIESRFSNDHLHLMSAGYRQWKKILLPYLKVIHPA